MDELNKYCISFYRGGNLESIFDFFLILKKELRKESFALNSKSFSSYSLIQSGFDSIQTFKTGPEAESRLREISHAHQDCLKWLVQMIGSAFLLIGADKSSKDRFQRAVAKWEESLDRFPAGMPEQVFRQVFSEANLSLNEFLRDLYAEGRPFSLSEQRISEIPFLQNPHRLLRLGHFYSFLRETVLRECSIFLKWESLKSDVVICGFRAIQDNFSEESIVYAMNSYLLPDIRIDPDLIFEKHSVTPMPETQDSLANDEIESLLNFSGD